MSKPLMVIADHLRELGLEDVARWVEHPDAVRELLSHAPIERVDYEEVGCAGVHCDGGDPTSEYGAPHSRNCPVIKAWSALGDPRAVADVQRAHGRALDDSNYEMRLVAQAKCPHHQVVARKYGSQCPVCQKWWTLSETASVVAGRTPVKWGDSPGERMESVSRAVRGGMISKEEARRIMEMP